MWLLFFFGLWPLSAWAGVDNALYAELLANHVHGGLVDYAGLKADRAGLDAYLDHLAEVRPGELSRDEQMAFYINLYNARTLQLVVDNYPEIETIKDLGGLFSSPWKEDIVRLDGKLVSLDHLEHDIIRPVFQDERVHFALNCSARSCPPLFDRPFEGRRIEVQLERVARAFVNDSEFNRLDGGTLYVSRIFKWFSRDFPPDLIGWFLDYASGDFRKELEELVRNGDRPGIRYLDYDWSLNDAGR
ncbi:DUF547 domain-containing protein [Pseudodesulfovibrio tunisiensis]|uniref:DUF547 domain-containing protein n=1 Tax=Pseudodesulfovibrio tunisiensis TaxID=463192 RepID=UPI001FB2A9AE|nr:DUF547 domain-containing protein [Pseudodesulfovibrio tunisiensis]